MRWTVPLIFWLLAAPASAQPPFDAATIIQSRLTQVAPLATDGEPLQLRISDDEALDGVIQDGILNLSPAAIGLLHNRAEVDGLLVTLISFAGDDGGADERHAKRAGLGDYLGLLAFTQAKHYLDAPDRTHQRELRRRGDDAPTSSGSSDTISGNRKGWRALQLLTKVGSCNGAALDALNRIARAPATANAPIARLASEARAGFGASALPPDRSCIRD